MAVRRESVVLDLNGNFTRESIKAASAFALVNREVEKIDKGPAAAFTRGTTQIDRGARRADASINQLSGRLSLLAKTAAVLGPGFAPIATATVPAVTMLATQLGFAAVAGGTAVLAFGGVGDALSTLREAQLNPTTKNLEKAREAMEKLSPAAQEFVRRLSDMSGAFKGVRDAAAEGLMPGMTEALDDVEKLLPRVSAIVRTIGDATGDLIAQGAESLAGSEWEDYFAFIEREARPTLMSLGKTVGNLARGVAELWMAFDPLTDDLTEGLLGSARAFAQWADTLDQTEGFEDFLAYVRQTGPQVADTLGSIVMALVHVGEAAAPLGGPVLKGLELVADAISMIADSPLGTPIMTAVAAFSALSLVTNTWSRTSQTAWVTNIRGANGYVAAMGAVRRASLIASAGIGALALSATGSATGMSLTNTAMGAMAGSIAGPWGIAIGAGIGATADFAAANDDLWESLDRAQQLLADGAPSEQFQAALDDATKKVAELERAMKEGTEDFDFWKKTKNSFEDIFGKSDVEEANDALRSTRDAAQDAAGMAELLGTAMYGTAGAYRSATSSADEFRASFQAINTLLDKSGSLIAYERSLDQLTASIKEHGRTWQVGTEAGRANLEARNALVEKAITRAEVLKEAGDDLGAQRILGRALEDLKKFAADAPGTQAIIEDLQGRLAVVDKTNAKPTVTPQTADAHKTLSVWEEFFASAGGKKAEPKIDPQTKGAHDKLNVWDQFFTVTGKKVATPKVDVQTGDSFRQIQMLQAAINGLRGRVVTIGTRIAGGLGNMVDNLGFADGGWTGPGGKYEPKGVVHGDEYVFSQEATQGNVAMLEALHRQLRGETGAGVAYAPAPRQATVASPTAPGPLVVTGTLQTPWGPAHIEGIARDVAREEIDADKEFDRSVHGG